MTTLDIIIIILLGLFFLLSLFKGLIREIFSLLGYLGGYIFAINYNTELAGFLQGLVPQEIMARIAGFAIIFIVAKIIVALIIFVVVKFLFGLLGRIIRRFIDGSKVLTLPDRFLGGVVGLGKGLVFIAIIMFPLSLFEDSYKNITQGSLLTPFFEDMVSSVSLKHIEINYMNKIPKLPLNDIQNRIQKMSDLKTITKEVDIKKDALLKSVENFVSQDNNHENITEEDKNKLNELLKSLSNN